MAQERGKPDRIAAGDQTQPHEATAQDRPRLPVARGPAGRPREQPHPVRGVGAPAPPVLVDDAPRLEPMRDFARMIRHHFAEIVVFRAPVHQRRARGRRQRHPERQATGERLQEHGLLRHHDLPGLRQTRPQSRHHHLTITHHKQRIAISKYRA